LEPILSLDSAEVFFDGIFSEPRLRHPEGIAIDTSGDIWCGGETGEIYRNTSRNCLYVSDSYDPKEKGPGVWRFDLENGEGGLWYDEAMTFANGMALSPERDHLYVAESFAGRVIRIPIDENGNRKKANRLWKGSSVCPTAWHSTPQATCTSPATNPRVYTG
jgi:SMP-30/Gluconolactonase/LRE-like region